MVEAVRAEVLDSPLRQTADLGHSVNRRLNRQDLNTANMTAALELISVAEIHPVLRRQLEVLRIDGDMDCELPVDGKLEVIVPVPAIENIAIVGRLHNVQELVIAFVDEFYDFPIVAGDLPRLQRLAIDYTDLTTLPPEIGCLTALTTLSLYNNRFGAHPARNLAAYAVGTHIFHRKPLDNPAE